MISVYLATQIKTNIEPSFNQYIRAMLAFPKMVNIITAASDLKYNRTVVAERSGSQLSGKTN